jgi:PAS domain S-box-containing protein
MTTHLRPSPHHRPPARAQRDRIGSPSVDPVLIAEIESVARLGWYALDVAADRWLSSAGLDVILGIGPAFERTLAGWASLVHPADRDAMVAYFTDEVLGARRPFDRQYRIVRADSGEERWVHGRGTLEFDRSGRPVRMFGTIADVSDQRRAQQTLVESELRYAAIFEGAIEAILIADQATERFRWANPAASALLGYTRDELLGLSVRDVLPAGLRAVALEAFRGLGVGHEVISNAPCLRRDGSLLLADIKASAMVIDGAPCVVGFFSDVTDLRRVEAQRDRLIAAVEQTSDSVVITDPAGTIEYVNPAFERASGFSRAEVIGANPRLLKSGVQSAAFYRALWHRLTSGRSWAGTLVNRRKDGSRYEVEAVISPVRGRDGAIAQYVGVERDVTALRAAESSLAREFRERAQVAAALARLQPAGSAEETATEICDELIGLPGVDLAAIINFLDVRRAVTLAAHGPDGMPVAAGRSLPATRAAYLYGRAAQGPWAEAWQARPEDGSYGEAMAAIGIRACAYAPIRNGEGLLGVVATGTRDEAYARHLIEQLPAVAEFAATASALLSRDLERGRRAEVIAGRIARVLADGAFRPVFQPAFALATGRPIGYEALTRFDDGTPPDRMISEAHSVGMGTDLEVACVAAGLEAAATLPPGAWLSLNVSPDIILHSRRFARLLRGVSRRIVIEVTEHHEIEDYGAIRRAVNRLGPGVSLAVDDAGSGFASLRHVVELRPQFLKLDLSLVRGVDRDATRQAMIAGLRHFASRVGCEVIAEGIEQPAELDMLRELGVPLGQGYLLGRPAPSPAPRAARRRGSATATHAPRSGGVPGRVPVRRSSPGG